MNLILAVIDNFRSLRYFVKMGYKSYPLSLYRRLAWF